MWDWMGEEGYAGHSMGSEETVQCSLLTLLFGDQL